MKAIIITQDLKDKNKLFKNRAVNSIYTGSIPNVFWKTERVVGGYISRIDLHQNDGWFDVVNPPYDTETQKLGALFFDVDKFTYPVLEKTPEEIEQYNQQQLDSDNAQQKVNQRKSDGILGFDRIFAIVERKYKAGEITGPQAKSAVKILYPLVEPLYKGMWIEAQTRLNEAEATIPALLQPLYEDIRTVVNDYVTNTYQ